jgi:dTDP-4-dehydrorhamnose 3,5-epimerase
MRVIIEAEYFGAVKVLRPDAFQDHRGFFLEAYRQDEFAKVGLPTNFVQLNHSGSVKNVVRGLHFQWQPPMGKLMRVVRGAALIVAVDVRKGSPTLGRWASVEASADNRLAMWAPASFARGFAVRSDFAEIEYLCTGTFNGVNESGIRWNDPEIGIEWGVDEPILSERDTKAQTLREWLARPESDQFAYSP